LTPFDLSAKIPGAVLSIMALSSPDISVKGGVPLISIVVPFYNESEMIDRLLEKLEEIIRFNSGYRWELILVDDGSTDDSVERLDRARPRFSADMRLIRFSRNFGHQPALIAGLEKTTGDAVIVLDADLQDPPELITQFLQKWREGYEVVYGVRNRRDGAGLKRLSYWVFYRIFQQLAEVQVPLDAGDFGLISRRVVDVIKIMREQDVFVRGMRSWVGYRQVGIPYDRPERHAGTTKYRFVRLLKLASSAFFGYSSLPLRFATVLGLASVSLSLLYGGYSLYGKFIIGQNPPGWTSLVMVILGLGGSQLVSIGILGEYVGRTYRQSLNRPLYVIAEDRPLPK
jgi:glycosyltransferase involved in cell wall biosynthesis